MRIARSLPAVLLALFALSGCVQEMADSGRIKPFDTTDFFDDGMTSRSPVAHTVARDDLGIDELRQHGTIDGELADRFPFAVDDARIERGRERFDIFCSPCHDRVGSGRGMVVQRGYRQPPSFHIERLREAPAGHFFDVITRGFGAMPSYAAQIPIDDRWAIVAYIRALQLSQNATLDDVPQGERAVLERQR